MQAADSADARVERLWPDEVIVCLGSGPSLTQTDVDFCRGRAKVIAVKDALRMAPWADVLYGAGSDSSQWWQRPGNLPLIQRFNGLKFALDEQAKKAGAIVLKNGPSDGLSLDPTKLALGQNSGYQAVNLAVLLGASRIVLLGYDMQTDSADRDHFFGQHPHGKRVPLTVFIPHFQTLIGPLQSIGVTVVNASRQTALTCFHRVTLDAALRQAVAA